MVQHSTVRYSTAKEVQISMSRDVYFHVYRSPTHKSPDVETIQDPPTDDCKERVVRTQRDSEYPEIADWVGER